VPVIRIAVELAEGQDGADSREKACHGFEIFQPSGRLADEPTARKKHKKHAQAANWETNFYFLFHHPSPFGKIGMSGYYYKKKEGDTTPRPLFKLVLFHFLWGKIVWETIQRRPKRPWRVWKKTFKLDLGTEYCAFLFRYGISHREAMISMEQVHHP
jgi:predicted membrane-bound mannosyltransferase